MRDDWLSIAVPTGDRPEILEQCLAHLQSSLSASGQLFHVTVVDNSSRAEYQDQNRRTLDKLTTHEGAEYTHLIPSAIHSFLGALQQPVASPQANHGSHGWDTILSIGVEACPSLPSSLPRFGLGRNAILLRNVGGPFLSLDDDIRIELSELSDAGEAPRSTSPESQTSVKLQETLNASPLHSLLPFPVEVAPCPSSRLLDLISVIQGNNLHNDPDAQRQTQGPTPKLSMCGVQGNRHYHRAQVAYYANGSLRGAVFQKKKTYVAAKTSGLSAMQSPSLVLTKTPFLATFCFAADATEILPPFPPVGRSEDFIFAILVKHMYPNNQIAHLPFMVRHDLGPTRPFSESHFHNTGLDFGTITRLVIQHLIDTALPLEGEPALRRLGQRLIDLASLPHQDWVQLTHRLYLGFVAGEIRELERLLEKHNGKPGYWAKDVQGYIALVQQEAAKTENVIPTELRDAHSPEAAGEVHRAFSRSYGELLCVWPEIWQAAVNLKESGWEPT